MMFHSAIQESSPSQEDDRGPVVVLPLNLIALIISYLDDVADLARACRTCRVLHYMTLPQLYQTVKLHSHDNIRYINGRPQGCGSASPFSMGLNGLITRNVVGLVRSFGVSGTWKEHDLEEHARVGRVPDNSMMLNMVVRAAVDRMDKLESFSWELNTKLLATVYQGLALRPSLTALSIKFPSLRLPRPTLIIPPMPQLRALKITDIDPLCYPDDISLLLLQSRNLRDLKMHWSPRMRDSAEPSVILHSYFNKCIAANYAMPLEHMSVKNLYALHDTEFDQVINPKTMRCFTCINCKGGLGSTTQTAFIDNTWLRNPPKVMWELEMLREDTPSKIGAELIARAKGLERLYLVDPKRSTASGPGLITNAVITPPDSNNNHSPPNASDSPDEHSSLLSGMYLDALTTSHGNSLRHLLLSAQWRLNEKQVARLVRGCPGLTQLGFAIEETIFSVLILLLPFLADLEALRIMNSAHMNSISDEHHLAKLKVEMAKPERPVRMRWLEAGQRVFEVGNIYYEGKEKRRQVRRIPWGIIPEPNIWSMDTLEI